MVTKEKDIFRDSALRYMGYTHEFGKILRPVINLNQQTIRYCYGASSVYYVMDMLHKAATGYSVVDGGAIKTVTRFGDAAVFHICASIIFPRIAVKYSQYGTRKLLQRINIRTTKNTELLPIGVSFLALPILSKPMDGIVNILMNCSYRLIFGR